MKKIINPILSIMLVITLMLTNAVPLNAAINVEGQGGSSANISGGGANTYNASDQMWKVSKKSDVKCYEQDTRYFYNSR